METRNAMTTIEDEFLRMKAKEKETERKEEEVVEGGKLVVS